uniref:BUB1 N-terminal domain-containing protein n=1 Tax=Scophthalmus maximus TaxID=52904 RepID=A0A8D3CV91_SCOMX
MDIASYLQCFEGRLSSYSGDDPLDPWDKFVECLEQRLPADAGSGMSLVFDSLVQRFLNVERYANDIRYVNYCIKCASYYSDPVALYAHVFSKGVGTRSAALYVAWAQQLEQRGANDQADALYQKATENQAQPADAVLHEYRQFQTRTRSQTSGSAGGVNPLQTSHLTNQMSSHREPVSQSKASVDSVTKPPAIKTIVTLSRSENSGVSRPCPGSGVRTVSEYMTDELVCDGSELSFEEVRAEKYFRKLRERREREHRENMERKLREQEEGIRSIKSMLEKVEQNLETCGGSAGRPSSQRLSAVEAASHLSPNPTQHSFGRPLPSNLLSRRRSLGLALHNEPTFLQEATAPSSEVSQHPSVLADGSVHLPTLAPAHRARLALQPVSTGQSNPSLHRAPCAAADDQGRDAPVQPGGWERCRPLEHDATHQDVSQLQEPEEKLNVSQGGTVNLSHITPNNSLGYVQATPSRVLPSPTVNTREALGVIMDMFQAPTLLEDPFNSTSAPHTAETELDAGCPRNGGASVFTNPPAMAPFTIFQDDNDKENGSAAAASAPAVVEKLKPIRALAEIPASKTEKPNDTPSDLMPDESAMWGARYNSLNSLAACPNSTTDFAMLAQFVSTPSACKTPFGSNFYQDQENSGEGVEADDDAFIRRQPKKTEVSDLKYSTMSL